MPRETGNRHLLRIYSKTGAFGCKEEPAPSHAKVRTSPRRNACSALLFSALFSFPNSLPALSFSRFRVEIFFRLKRFVSSSVDTSPDKLPSLRFSARYRTLYLSRTPKKREKRETRGPSVADSLFSPRTSSARARVVVVGTRGAKSSAPFFETCSRRRRARNCRRRRRRLASENLPSKIFF